MGKHEVWRYLLMNHHIKDGTVKVDICSVSCIHSFEINISDKKKIINWHWWHIVIVIFDCVTVLKQDLLLNCTWNIYEAIYYSGDFQVIPKDIKVFDFSTSIPHTSSGTIQIRMSSLVSCLILIFLTLVHCGGNGKRIRSWWWCCGGGRHTGLWCDT